MAYARFGSRLAREVVEIADNVQCLDQGGFWAATAMTSSPSTASPSLPPPSTDLSAAV